MTPDAATDDLPREPTRHPHCVLAAVADDAAAVRAFQPAAVAIVGWTRIMCLVLGAVLAIVVATVLTLDWLDGRIKARVAPVEYRLERIEGKVDRVLDALRAKP